MMTACDEEEGATEKKHPESSEGLTFSSDGVRKERIVDGGAHHWAETSTR